MKSSQGFTLLELVIAVIIISTVAMIAIPAYYTYVQNTRRYEALATLESIYLLQERYRLTHSSYAKLSDVWENDLTDNGYYQLSISGITSSGFNLTASALDSQANDREGNTSCSNLILTVQHQKITRTPSECWKN